MPSHAKAGTNGIGTRGLQTSSYCEDTGIPGPAQNVGEMENLAHHMEGLGEDTDATAYRGKEHGECVDSSFQDVSAPNGQDHGWQKHEVAQAEQQSGQQLESIGERVRTVRAAPAPPPCGWGGHRVEGYRGQPGVPQTLWKPLGAFS